MPHTTHSTKSVSAKDIQREWRVIDVNGKVLGRIANEIATLLQGKHKTNYVPYLDMGDHVVVINAKDIDISGKKESDKMYTYFSGYPGGLREVSYATQIKKNPQEVIRHAVSGMLPKNKLRDQRLARLHIFTDDKHPFTDKVK